MKAPHLTCVVFAVTLFVLVGCGGDDDVSAPDTTTETVATADVDTTPDVTTTPSLDDLPEVEPFGKGAVELTAPDGTIVCSCVLVADTTDERSQGLMGVTDLQGYAGMVFVWDSDATSSFTMRNTPMPLSIGWFGFDGEVVSESNMEPCVDGGNCPSYPAGGSYRYALEVPQGELPTVGVTEGATFRLVDDCNS